MPRFSICNPYFIIVLCLVVLVIGTSSVARMLVDLDQTESRSLLGGLRVSVVLTPHIMPAAYLLIHGKKQESAEAPKLA